MEKIAASPFSSLKIPSDANVEVKNNVLYVTKWNWDFANCESFQLEALEFVRQNKQLKIFIFCNHPHCFTLGRGNERDQDNLIEFDESIEKKLKYPLYRIHRGGGITFHYPGQWIFYPICAVNEKYSLDDHMCWILTEVKNVLKSSFGITNALSAKKLMGIWVDRSKLASIGVGLKKFVTLHGLALNLVYDKAMFNELLKINPCGLSSETYICLDSKITSNPGNLVENFHQEFMKSVS